MKPMKFWLTLVAFFACSLVLTQWQAQSKPNPLNAVQAQASDVQKANVQQYVELLGSNVQQEKAQIMGAVLQLNKDEADKFWPIYNDYESELTKLNEQRTKNIQEYARSYNQLTNERANELVKAEIDAMKQHADIVNKYHGRVQESLGPVNAARFFEIDSQLNSLIDLQIDSSLPVGQE